MLNIPWFLSTETVAILLSSSLSSRKSSDTVRRDYEVLLGELTQYNPELLDKERLLAVTKCDTAGEEELAALREQLPEGIRTVFISSVSGYNIPQLKDALWETLRHTNDRKP